MNPEEFSGLDSMAGPENEDSCSFLSACPCLSIVSLEDTQGELQMGEVWKNVSHTEAIMQLLQNLVDFGRVCTFRGIGACLARLCAPETFRFRPIASHFPVSTRIARRALGEWWVWAHGHLRNTRGVLEIHR